MKNTIETKRIKILNIVKNLNGKFFTVEFIKKDNTLRKMNSRTGVKKYLSHKVNTDFNTSNGKKIKLTPPIENGILRVWDRGTQQYRSINIDTVQSIKFQGRQINFLY